MAKKFWIKGAIKHPGRLTEAAKRAGAMTDDTIKVSWLRKTAKGGGSLAKAARLALTLRKF